MRLIELRNAWSGSSRGSGFPARGRKTRRLLGDGPGAEANRGWRQGPAKSGHRGTIRPSAVAGQRYGTGRRSPSWKPATEAGSASPRFATRAGIRRSGRAHGGPSARLSRGPRWGLRQFPWREPGLKAQSCGSNRLKGKSRAPCRSCYPSDGCVSAGSLDFRGGWRAGSRRAENSPRQSPLSAWLLGESGCDDFFAWLAGLPISRGAHRGAQRSENIAGCRIASIGRWLCRSSILRDRLSVFTRLQPNSACDFGRWLRGATTGRHAARASAASASTAAPFSAAGRKASR